MNGESKIIDISQWNARLKEQLERSFHNYQVHKIDLSVARDNEKLDWTGETIIVEKASSATAIAMVRLMFDDADELILEKNVEIKSIFNKVYLSNEVQADEWLVMIIGINFEYKKKIGEAGGGGLTFVDRGDPQWPDFMTGSFTADNKWHDLDLSSIVPAGVTLVFLRTTIQKSQLVYWLYLKKKGIVNNINCFSCYTQGGDAAWMGNVIQPCDSDRVIEYRLFDGEYDVVEILVRGWFK